MSREQLKNISLHISAYFGQLLLLIILLPIIAIYRTLRILINLVLHSTTSLRMVADEDEVWLQDTEANAAVINSVIIFDEEPPDIKAMRQRFLRHLAVKLTNNCGNDNGFFKLTSVPVKFASWFGKKSGFTFWKQLERFNVDDHVSNRDCPTRVRSEVELFDEIGRICSEPLDRSKPLWYFYVLHRVLIDNKTVAIFRCHHAIADGISLIKFCNRLLVDCPAEVKVLDRVGEKTRLNKQKIFEALLEMPLVLFKTLLMPRETHTVGNMALTGRKRIAWTPDLSLNQIRQTKNKLKCTVNDVMFAAVAGSLRRWMQQEQHSISNLTASVPMFLPGSIADKNTVELHNNFAVVFVELPCKEQNALERLRRVQQIMIQMKNSPAPIINIWLLKLTQKLFPSFIKRPILDVLADKSAMVLSNVPGPSEYVYVCDQRVTNMVFWPPQRNHVGIGISILSYSGSVKVGVMVDEVITNSPQNIIKFVGDELKYLRELKV